MLSRLQVRNYVLIDSLEIAFPEGLIIITGQTGAGKSILLGALSLVTGAKADASMVSEGADNCVVEAEFEVNDSRVGAVLEENDVDQDGDHVIVRRVVNRSGRSRAFVNDCPVPVQVLQELSSLLIDVHSQHQTLLLTDKRFQMSLLDSYAGNAPLLDECAALWRRHSAVRSELAALEQRIAAIAGERDYNEAQFRQLEAASLKVGELACLEEEQKQLANAEEIRNSLAAVSEMFTSASSGGEVPPMDSSLKESVKVLSRLSRYLPVAQDLAERVDSCRRELDDILSEVMSIAERTDVSESRLQEVEERMSLIYSLMQKHSCHDEEALIALRDRLSDELFDSTQLEEKRDNLIAEERQLASELEAVADRLHDSRCAASVPFSEDMQELVRSLELPYAVFETGVENAALSASGKDQVVFRFSSTGRNPVDLAKCASGGELSRIMLALKAMGARYANMPTLIFDEIDTGVSGSVADRMGSMICSMGSDMQVFAITHLPQVAAKGSAHYLVSKDIDPSSSKAVSTIKRLSDEQRVLELARMLSGSELTDAAVANARVLLSI
ncbi:MAG: DNA repair protein RecN [Bacteroidales bacterium]|nr:DNA repair protein RecN [Bacteroidales bacterium]